MASCESTEIWEVKVLVAATPISGPDCWTIYTRETRVKVEPTIFVRPKTVAARNLALSTASNVSAVSPDWLTPSRTLSILTDLPCCSTNSEAITGWVAKKDNFEKM